MSQRTRLTIERLDDRVVPATLPVTLSGGGASWTIDDAGGTAAGVADGSPGLRIDDATLDASGRTDVFDGGGVVVVNGTPLVAPAAVTVTGQSLAAGPVAVGGLNVTVEYAAAAASPTLRTLVTLTNPGAAPVTVPVQWLSNLGSDVGTAVAGTSSGDATFDAADRWVVTDDADPTGGTPAVLHVLAGLGALPDAVSRTVFENAGTQGVRADYAVTVPAGGSRSLLFFHQIRDDRAAKLAAATGFDGNPPAGGDLLARLTAAQLATVANWDFTRPPFIPPPPPPVNAPPALSDIVVSASNEGSPATLTGRVADPDSAGPFAVTVTWGDGATETFTAPAGAFTRTHTYGTDTPGGYGVSVVAADSLGAVSPAATANAAVANVAPTVAGLSATLAAQGTPVTLSGTVGDPGAADTFVATVEWGDGGTDTYAVAAAGPFAFTHTYTGVKAYPIRVTVADNPDSVTATTTVAVANVPPTIARLAATAAGNAVTLTAAVGDPGSDGQLTLTVDWGDGQSVTLPPPAGAATFSQPHTYAAFGSYAVKATVTDGSGATASANTSVAVGPAAGATSRVPSVVAVGSPAGVAPTVTLLDTRTRQVVRTLTPFEPSFTGGVTVATADVNGDGVADVVAGAAGGGGPRVVVFDGVTGAVLWDFYAYDPASRGGVNVAAADLDGDGRAEVVTGAGVGGAPHVRVFSGLTGNLLAQYYAGDSDARGGVTVAAMASGPAARSASSPAPASAGSRRYSWWTPSPATSWPPSRPSSRASSEG